MAYEAKTQNDLAKWWVIGTGSVVNRLSEIMDDCPNGPAIYYTTGWTAAGAEYYRTQATANDSCQEKIGAGAWSALVLGAGIGALNAGEYFYDGATTSLYVRLTGDAVPNATNQVRAHYLWDGSGAGPLFMTEVVVDQLYTISLNFEIGDGTTSTTLASTLEAVQFLGCYPKAKSSATLTLGQLQGSKGIYGAQWLINYNTTWICVLSDGSTANVNIYGSMITCVENSALAFLTGNIDIRDSIIAHCWVSGYSDRWIIFYENLATISIVDTYFNGYYQLQFSKTATLTSLRCHFASRGIWVSAANQTVTGISISEATTPVVMNISGTTSASLVDPKADIGTPQIDVATNTLLLKYTVAIHIADKTGADLSGATVTWLDSQSNTGNANTDVNGDVSFTLTSKQWAGTSETLTNFNPFTFTISKAGYQTLVLENITLSEAVDWHLELQDEIASGQATHGGSSVQVIRRAQFIPEPEYIPVPIPMVDGIMIEKDPNEMTQKEYEQWRRRGGGG